MVSIIVGGKKTDRTERQKVTRKTKIFLKMLHYLFSVVPAECFLVCVCACVARVCLCLRSGHADGVKLQQTVFSI